MYDLIIIGAGPAGMTAAIYAKRANLKVALLEKGAPGGQILNTYEIENYTGFKKQSGFDLAMQMYQHTQSLGIETIFQEVLEVKNLPTHKEIKTPNQTIKTHTVLLATGAIPRTLNVENEGLFSSNGISWCAICDGPLYKDKDVVVIGGGNSAVEEALFLSSITKSVTLIQNLSHLTADKKSIEHLQKQTNVRFIFNATVLSFVGQETLEGVLIKTPHEEVIIKTDGVFEFIGLEPVTKMVKKLKLTDQYGYIIANEKMETKIPGIYSAGDVNQKQIRQVVTAVSDGAVAVTNIIKYLENLKHKE